MLSFSDKEFYEILKTGLYCFIEGHSKIRYGEDRTIRADERKISR